jgi:predicted component of type VI protein secretion system
MTTLRTASLAFLMAVALGGCNKQKPVTEPPKAEDTTTATPADGTTPPADGAANPCAGNPCAGGQDKPAQ